jgi:hypothetical protein
LINHYLLRIYHTEIKDATINIKENEKDKIIKIKKGYILMEHCQLGDGRDFLDN